MSVPAEAVAPAVIELADVHKAFTSGSRTIRALDGFSARITPGCITGLVGPDGAGKTTLMRLLTGLLPPDSGQLQVLGVDPVREGEQVQAQVGYMPQRFGLYEDLSVAQNLTLYADLHGLPRAEREQRFARLLAFTGLEPFTKRLARNLSGGMKQKLGLACVLVHPPQLLLLDEPTVGVDPISRRELWAMIDQLVAGGASVLVSTAYLDEAEHCHEVLLMHEGKLLVQDRPEALRAPLRGRTYSYPVAGPGRRRLQARAQQLPEVMDAVLQGDRLRVLLVEGASAPPLPQEDGPPLRAEAVAPRFEDAFVALLAAQGVRPGRTAEPVGDDPATAGDAQPIRLEKVVRRFGQFEAVKGVSFSVERGEIFGLLGPNGAGKTTLIRMLCGLLPPTSGLARVLGYDLLHASGQVRAEIGYMSQKFSLYPNLTVAQNLRFFSGAYGLRGAVRVQRQQWALDAFELGSFADAVSGDLSLGHKQRLALACALMHRPHIVFLDEPTSGVDPIARREFWHRINALAEAGVTVLVTTHFLEEAEYCDRLSIMYAGRVIAEDTPTALKARAGAGASLEDVFVQLIEAQPA